MQKKKDSPTKCKKYFKIILSEESEKLKNFFSSVTFHQIFCHVNQRNITHTTATTTTTTVTTTTTALHKLQEEHVPSEDNHIKKLKNTILVQILSYIAVVSNSFSSAGHIRDIFGIRVPVNLLLG